MDPSHKKGASCFLSEHIAEQRTSSFRKERSRSHLWNFQHNPALCQSNGRRNQKYDFRQGTIGTQGLAIKAVQLLFSSTKTFEGLCKVNRETQMPNVVLLQIFEDGRKLDLPSIATLPRKPREAVLTGLPEPHKSRYPDLNQRVQLFLQ